MCCHTNPLGETLTLRGRPRGSPTRSCGPDSTPTGGSSCRVDAEATVAFLLRRQNPAGPEASLGTALRSGPGAGRACRQRRRRGAPETPRIWVILGAFCSAQGLGSSYQGFLGPLRNSAMSASWGNDGGPKEPPAPW